MFDVENRIHIIMMFMPLNTEQTVTRFVYFFPIRTFRPFALALLSCSLRYKGIGVN